MKKRKSYGKKYGKKSFSKKGKKAKNVIYSHRGGTRL